MYVVETNQSPSLDMIQEESNQPLEGTQAPDNSAVPTPSPLHEFELSYQRRRNSEPNVDKLIRLEHKIECSDEVMCCKFSPDSSVLAVGLTNGTILIYRNRDFQLLYSLQDNDTTTHHLPVTQIRFPVFPLHNSISSSDENKLIASYSSGHIKLWHYTSGSCLKTTYEDLQLLNIAYSPDGRRIVATGEKPGIFLYDRETMKKTSVLEASVTSLSFSPIERNQRLDGHCFRVFAAQYHPDEPHLFLTGGWDNTVHYWDDRQKHSIRSISGPHICGDAIDIEPIEKKLILTGSWRRKNPLEIWDFDTGKKVKDLPSESLQHCQLYCCQWLGKESVFCGGSDHNMAKVINHITITTKGLLTDLSQGVYCIDNDRSGNRPLMAVGSKNFIFILKPEKEV